MRYVYSYKEKVTGKVFSMRELEEAHEKDFESYTKFSEWLDENYIEICKTVLSPQERQRNAVYATGNKWAIENWNATHN